MWRCSKCGEENEDQFDSCWHCAPIESVVKNTKLTSRLWSGFFRSWRRGWLVLLLTFLVWLCLQGVGYTLRSAINYEMQSRMEPYPKLLVVAVLALGVLVLPPIAYLVFTLVFNEGAWGPDPKAPPSAEETARALMTEAAAIKDRGKTDEALAAYREVVNDYPQTIAAQFARQRLKTLSAAAQDKQR